MDSGRPKRGEAGVDDGPGLGGGADRKGTVRAVLPRALYRVVTDGGHDVIAHAPSGPGRNFVRLIEGDRVVIALAAHDARRGRIVRKVRP